MKYYKVHPEVPGGLGKRTKYEKTETPWELIDLHVVLMVGLVEIYLKFQIVIW